MGRDRGKSNIDIAIIEKVKKSDNVLKFLKHFLEH